MTPIKWRESDYNEIKRVVENFNRKLQRVKKRSPEIADIQPSRLKVSELIKSIETRKEFNRLLKSIKKYSERGAEKPAEGVEFKVTKYEYQKAKEELRILNIKKAYKRKQAKDTGLELTAEKMDNLRPKKFLAKSKEEFEKLQESLERQLSAKFENEGLERYKQNYLKGLETNFGSQGQELAKLLKDVNAKKLFQKTAYNIFASISFLYDPQEIEEKIEAIKEELSELI